ncbi:MAG: hypothetical protein P8127_14340 [Acidobacteriota bacterium]
MIVGEPEIVDVLELDERGQAFPPTRPVAQCGAQGGGSATVVETALIDILVTVAEIE